MINRKFFYDTIRPLFGKISKTQLAGMETILDYWESEERCEKDDRHLAYAFATAFHETDKKMQAIEEYGAGKGKKYGKPDPRTGKVYFGRGLVQITWYENYDKMGKLLGIDLVNNPHLALNIDIATKIMFEGMYLGIFTGKKLSDYFNSTNEDWYNARRIINSTDKASLIAGYGKKFYAALSHKP